jgi:hypothetical protein
MANAQEVEKVEQLLAMLKMAGTGPGLKDTVARALAEPGLFVYGEIVELPSIQQVGSQCMQVLGRSSVCVHCSLENRKLRMRAVSQTFSLNPLSMRCAG